MAKQDKKANAELSHEEALALVEQMGNKITQLEKEKLANKKGPVVVSHKGNDYKIMSGVNHAGTVYNKQEIAGNDELIAELLKIENQNILVPVEIKGGK